MITDFKDILYPDSWDICRIRSCCTNVTDGSHFSPEAVSEGYNFVTVSDVKGGLIDLEHCSKISEEDWQALVSAGCKPSTGDVLLTKDGTVGQTAIVSDDNFVALSSLAILSPNNLMITEKYLDYWLQSPICQSEMESLMAGSALRRLTLKKINGLTVALPPLEIQDQIVIHLDRIVKVIDGECELINNLILQYNDLKQSLITEAVTKGLDPSVPMKDSGVEWVGSCPNEWQICPVKVGFNIVTGSTPSTSKTSYWDGDIAWITPADMDSSKKYVSGGQRYITQAGFDSSNLTMLSQGDIVLSTRAPIGVVNVADSPMCTNQGCKSLSPKNGFASDYYFYVFKACSDFMASLGAGTTFMELSRNDLNNLSIPRPSVKEQREIASYLDGICNNIASIIQSLTDIREKYKELKQSVIYEYVTGKTPVEVD